MADTAEQQPDDVQREYVRTGVWLLILMALKVGFVSVEMPRMVMVVALLILMLLKLWLITAVFMHLKFERLGLVLLLTVPVFFALLLFFGILPDITMSPWIH